MSPTVAVFGILRTCGDGRIEHPLAGRIPRCPG